MAAPRVPFNVTGLNIEVPADGQREVTFSVATGVLDDTWTVEIAGTTVAEGDGTDSFVAVFPASADGQRWQLSHEGIERVAGVVIPRPLRNALDLTTLELTVDDGGTVIDIEVDAVGPVGPPLSDASPQPPGAASPGLVSAAARGDHVHPPPTAGQIGAATAADIAAAVAGRQPLDSDLTAIAALATTSWGRALLTLADAAAARAVLGAATPADIEAAIDAIPGPPTAVFAVPTLDMSGGSWTVLPGIGLPRMFLVGLPVLVLQGADRGLWTVTASGPCTPLPDPGGAVIAVTAQQAVASPIVDQMAQPAGWVLGPSAEVVTVLDSRVTWLTGQVSTLHDASAITTGVMAAARLGSGTASVGTVLTGAGTWAPRGYRLIAGQPYDGGATKSGTAVTTQDRVAWTTLEGLALGSQVDALWVDVTTGGSTGATVQLSLLADDGYGRPGALLAQTAQLPAETSTAIVMGTFTAVTLTTSTIHIGVHVRSTAQPTLRAISSRATCIPSSGASTSDTMAWSSTIAGAAVAANPAVDVSSAACYRAGIRGA